MLPKNVSEEEVSALFSKYGAIKDMHILRGVQQTSKGTSKFNNRLAVFSVYLVLLSYVLAGCAFLKYERKEEALEALNALNGIHKMKVFSIDSASV